MATSEQCKRRAAECRQLAESAASREHKRILLELALEWDAMAEQAERFQGGSSVSPGDLGPLGDRSSESAIDQGGSIRLHSVHDVAVEIERDANLTVAQPSGGDLRWTPSASI